MLSPSAHVPHSCPHFRVLGVRVDAVQIPDVVARMEDWIDRRQAGRFIAVTGMHGMAESSADPDFRRVLAEADLVVPDGMPLIWLGRTRGHSLRRRVYGPDLMLAFCERSVGRGYRHYFYGGPPGLARRLAETLCRRFPGLRVAGTYSPPFRDLAPEEWEKVRREIEGTAPDVLWVGLSTPKQERWMHAHRRDLSVPVLVGVGPPSTSIAAR